MRYYLTDGKYLARMMDMKPEEAARANEQSEITTGGTWWWSPIPPESIEPKEEDNAN